MKKGFVCGCGEVYQTEAECKECESNHYSLWDDAGDYLEFEYDDYNSDYDTLCSTVKLPMRGKTISGEPVNVYGVYVLDHIEQWG